MLRTFAALLFALPAWSQTEVPAANFEVIVADLSAVANVSSSLPMNAVFSEGAVATFIEDAIGEVTGSDLIESALSSRLPGLSWVSLAAGASEIRIRGHMQRDWTESQWIVAQVKAQNEELATSWMENFTPSGEAPTGHSVLPAELADAQWVSSDTWIKRVDSTVLIGFGGSPPASVASPFGEFLGATLVEARPGAISVLEARGHFGLAIEYAAGAFGLPEAIGGWLAGIGDAHAHMRMEVLQAEPDQPRRILTRIRRDAAAETQTNTTEEAFGIQPLELESLRGLSDTAMFANATTMDASLAIPMLLQSGELDTAALEAQLGFKLDRLWSRLGPNVVMWADPISGPAIPASFVQVETREPEAMRADLTKMLEALAASDASLEVKTRDYKVKDVASGKRIPIAITTVRSQGINEMLSSVGASLNPALCVYDGSLLIATSSTRMKKELKRRASGEAAGQLNLDKPLLALGLKGATTVWNFDYVKMIDGLLSLAKVAGGMAGDMLPVDLSQLPKLDTFARHIRPTFHAQGIDDKGRWIVHEASFGPETWLGMTGFVTKVMESFMSDFGGGGDFGATGIPEETTEELPAPSVGTASILSELRVGITVYEITTGESPDSLNALVVKSDSLPAGCLATDTVPVDSWGNAFRYVKKTEGGYSLWSLGADGIDQNGAGDDVVAKL